MRLDALGDYLPGTALRRANSAQKSRVRRDRISNFGDGHRCEHGGLHRRGDDATGPNPRHVEVWRQRATAFSGLTYLQKAAMGLTLGAEHPRLTSAAPQV